MKKIVILTMILFMAVSVCAEDVILIGTSSMQSGPAAFYGLSTSKGYQSYINEINANGGINGKQIKRIQYDDVYNPDTCAYYTKKLNEEDKVLALVAYVGTPTMNQAIPYIDNTKIPTIGAYTGGEFLYTKFHPSFFTFKPAYSVEAYALTLKLIDFKKYNKIAVFYQDDAYGLSGLKGVNKALKEKGMELAAKGKNLRDSLEVAEAITEISAANPDCVILLSTIKPNLTFLTEWKKSGLKAKFAVITGGGPDFLKDKMPDMLEGSLCSQAVPLYSDLSNPAAKEYNELLKKYFPEANPDYVGFEGFLNAKFFVEALKKIEGDINRVNLIKAIENIKDMEIGIGEKISFSSENHSGLNKVWMVEINNGKYIDVK
ncbi:ABC transporter substrate-binding protein [Candidatus Dependentiae bacterium]|nr:ABC transporter substrate-binding protein [Candidatus Dependentiae bacterium]